MDGNSKPSKSFIHGDYVDFYNSDGTLTVKDVGTADRPPVR
jgi:hypothetical protein